MSQPFGNLRVLTYNTQLRSWGMEMLAQKCLPTTTAEERAGTIARRILESAQDYDVICLNEVFDEDAREILRVRLIDRYPHAVLKADSQTPGSSLMIASGGALLTLPGIGWAVGAGLAIAGLLRSKFEDSGLMLFSRLPFARGALEADGISYPDAPIVTFVPYEDANPEDGMAAKGILYAQLSMEEGRLHLFATHTQADGGNAGIRAKQLNQAWALVTSMAGAPPFSEEVLLCGDLNINPLGSDEERAEWAAVFQSGTHPFSHHLHDVWHREQCPGAHLPGGPWQPGGAWAPLPPDSDPGKTIVGGRLDYMLRSAAQFKDRMTTQHMAIAYDVAQEIDPAKEPTAYTSDHLPLRIDLAPSHPQDNVTRAGPLVFAEGKPDQSAAGTLGPGAMQWWRIDQPGGYAFGLSGDDPNVGYEVYDRRNLSVPVKPFDTLLSHLDLGRTGLDMTRYALPEQPFFIRVFNTRRERGAEAAYELWVHRFEGTSREDAIPLSRGFPFAVPPKLGAQHSDQDDAMPTNTFDSVWYVIWTDPPLSETRPQMSVRLERNPTSDADSFPFGLVILTGPPGEPPLLIHETPAGQRPIEHAFPTEGPLPCYVLVRREDEQAFAARDYWLTVNSNVSYLYSNPNDPQQRALDLARLRCDDETNGFMGSEAGNDDIHLDLIVGGDIVVTIPHSDWMKFSDGTPRDLPAIGIVSYVEGATVKLIELDDTSDHDVAQVAIGSIAQLVAAERKQHGIPPDTPWNPTAVRSFELVFDQEDRDGIYQFSATISPEPPPTGG